MRRPSEVEFARALVQRAVASLRRVQACLQEAEQRRSRGQPADLGELLVRGGHADPKAVRALQAEMGLLTLSCPACGKAFPWTEEGTGPTRCDRCGGALVRRAGARGRATAACTAAESAADAGGGASGGDSLMGQVIGGCEIVERIAKGGMGVVYRARQLNLGRTVAIKILADRLTEDESFVRRFINEARAAAELNHGHIVHINDVGRYEGTYYINMEYVDGVNLRQLLKARGSLGVDEAVRIVRQVAEALVHAHARNIIHRDIKPENIMITRDGIVKVADLGLAKRIAGDESEGITQAGCVLGTPHYMAPEQARDFRHVDRRSDIYSLGVTFYRMLAGEVPFPGRSPLEVMVKAMQGSKTPLREKRPDVPPELEAVIERMMHRDPDARYQDLASALEDLDRIGALRPD